MDDFEGWDLAAFWRDLKFDIKHANDYQKTAMVGEAVGHDTMTQVMKPFTKATIRYFDRAQWDEALAWAEA